MERAGVGEGEDAAEEGVREVDDAGGGLGLEGGELGDDGVGREGCGGGGEEEEVAGEEKSGGSNEWGRKDRHCDGERRRGLWSGSV